jgi:hypothetical protein
MSDTKMTAAEIDAKIRAVGGQISTLSQERAALEEQRQLLIAEGKQALPQRWNISWFEEVPTLEQPTNSCRDMDCCLGQRCGYTLEAAITSIAGHFEGQKKYWTDPVTLLKNSGYDPAEYDMTGVAGGGQRLPIAKD